MKARKQIVLQQLGEEKEPIGLPDLLKKLGSEYPERTVRRWLKEMIIDGLVVASGQRRGTRYQAAMQKKSEIRYGFNPSSQEIIEQIKQPLYERLAVSYKEEWLESYQPNHSFYLSSNQRVELYAAGKRSQNEEPAGTYAHQIFNRLLIDLSYNSSRLEGNTYSLLDTQRLILEGVGAEGKLDEEKVMILNHKEAIRYLVDTAPRLRVDTQTICTLHYLLADGLVENRHAGKVRDHAVRIGGSTYIPLEDSKRLQYMLERILAKAALIENPYEQSFFLLVHVSYLQAFTDVNKRTARLSANIPLITSNLVPLSFNDVERDDYTSGLLAIYELQNVLPMADLFVFSYLHTCTLYDATVKAMGFDEVRVRYRNERRRIIQEVIVHSMIGQDAQEYIAVQTSKRIQEKDQEAFRKDVWEDLEEIDPSRLAGLGITPDQLESWKKKFSSNLS